MKFIKSFVSILALAAMLLGFFSFAPTTQAALSYGYQFVMQSGYPEIAQGGNGSLWIRIKNTGTATWDKSIVHLGTSSPLDRTSDFYDLDAYKYSNPKWASINRIRMEQATVAPGESADFGFYISVPENKPAGTYREYFRPVADGVSWMKDIGIFWDIIVTASSQQNNQPGLAQPEITSLVVTPTTVASGGTATATWQTSNATACSLSSADNTLALSSLPANGAINITNITKTQAYTFTCENSSNGSVARASRTFSLSLQSSNSASWPTFTDNVSGANFSYPPTWTVTATEESLTNAAYNFQIETNENATINNQTTDITLVLGIDKSPEGGIENQINNSISAGLSKNYTKRTINGKVWHEYETFFFFVSIKSLTYEENGKTHTLLYVLDENQDSIADVIGTELDQLRGSLVSLNSNAPTINSFSANQTSINTGASINFSWSASNTTKCEIDNSIGEVTPNGTKTVTSINNDITYTLTCNNVSAKVIIDVLGVPPDTPIGWFDITINGKKSLSWGTSGGATNYQLYRDSSPDGSFATKIYEGGKTSYEEQSFPAGTKYYYKVRAEDNEGLFSNFSSVETVTF